MPDTFPLFRRMKRLHMVVQHAVFDLSSASMAGIFHGVKPTLSNYLQYHYLIPQLPTFQAAVGLDGARQCRTSIFRA